MIPPQYVKPFVKTNKNDAADAEAICEALLRPTMRYAAVKSADQQAVLMLHRSRELLVRQRTMLINALRGHCGEFGLVAAQGARKVVTLIEVIEDPDDCRLPPLARAALVSLVATSILGFHQGPRSTRATGVLAPEVALTSMNAPCGRRGRGGAGDSRHRASRCGQAGLCRHSIADAAPVPARRRTDAPSGTVSGPAGGADEMKSWHPFSSTFAAKEASLADMGKGPSWTKIIEN